MNTEKLIEYLKLSLSPGRYEHCLSVGRTALILCQRFKVDTKEGYFAGLSHDIAREMEPEKLLELASEKYSISELEIKQPQLLHGKGGAVLIEKEFGITCEDVLEAVAYHTTGHPEMGTLSKIVYIADFIEPERDYDIENRTILSETEDLEDLFYFVLEKKISFLAEKKREISPLTLKINSNINKKVRLF